MCGKFTQNYTWPQVHAYSNLFAAAAAPEVEAEGAITPMRFALALHIADGVPAVTPMRWGFAGRDDHEPHRPRHMHARAETVDVLPTFAQAFAQRRCVILVDSFNEGEEIGARTQQWTIAPRNDALIAIAAIYEAWEREGRTLYTYVMVTTPPNALIGKITDRMPAILPPHAVETWLKGPPDAAKALLKSFDDQGAWDMQPQRKKSAQGDLFG